MLKSRNFSNQFRVCGLSINNQRLQSHVKDGSPADGDRETIVIRSVDNMCCSIYYDIDGNLERWRQYNDNY
jgi:hypothetical protein